MRSSLRQVAAVGVHVLPEQRDLLDAVGGELLDLPHDLRGPPAALPPAGARDDAVGADAVAADRDLDPAPGTGARASSAGRPGSPRTRSSPAPRGRPPGGTRRACRSGRGRRRRRRTGTARRRCSFIDCDQQPPTPTTRDGSSDFSRFASPRLPISRLSADSRIEQVLKRIRSACHARRLLVASASMPMSRSCSTTVKRCSSLATTHGALHVDAGSASVARRRAACWNSVSLAADAEREVLLGMQRAAERPEARAAAAGQDHRDDGQRRLPVTVASPPGRRRPCAAPRSASAAAGTRFPSAPGTPASGAAGGGCRRRQRVEVAELVVAALEVLRLDPALGEQRLQQVVRLAEADAELARELALRILGMLVEQRSKATAESSSDAEESGMQGGGRVFNG